MADVGMAPVEGIRSHRTLALAGRSVLTLMVAFTDIVHASFTVGGRPGKIWASVRGQSR